MADEFGITIQIAGRPYRLYINRNDEEGIRRATKSIEDQLTHYAGSYSFNDKQDLLAMVALHFATIAMNSEQETGFVKLELLDTLKHIDETLTEQLKD